MLLGLLKYLAYSFLALIAFCSMSYLFLYLGAYQPKPVEKMEIVCPADTPLTPANKNLKVMSWNVQFMAGKGYIFFFDYPDFSGPDTSVAKDDIMQTIDAIAQIIKQEKPDVILLQEVDDGAKRTHYEDQLQLLQERLGNQYPCHSSAFYSKTIYTPHPKIMGKTGMKLSTLSRYKMTQSRRHRLADIPRDPITQPFGLKRALLEVLFPLDNDKELTIINTHFSAFAAGTNTLELQMDTVMELLEKLDSSVEYWILGGDFNMVPPGTSLQNIHPIQRGLFRSDSEIAPLFIEYTSVFGLEQLVGANSKRYFTHSPNIIPENEPTLAIDYIFHSKDLTSHHSKVRQQDTSLISDHFPIITEFSFK